VKVLIVEDDASLARVIDRNLAVRGHTTAVVDTAEGAVMQMVEEWPDVLLMDVNLPDFSAWEILRRIDEGSRNRLRVVVTSAAPISQKRIAEFKPASVLLKPFVIGALLHAVEGTSEHNGDSSNESGG
jgi:DNA-binding response OmpR family regulator